MAEEESLKTRLELKVKKRDYTGYDDDEFIGGDQGPSKRSILAKYDEEINGRQQTVRIILFELITSHTHQHPDFQVGQFQSLLRSTPRRTEKANSDCP